MSLPKYPKIWALGHRYTKEIWNGPVEITEKIDGSQFSFGCIHGKLVLRSKNCDVYPDNPEKLFAPAVKHVQRVFDAGLLKISEYLYFGETLCGPRHNVLKYSHIPTNHIALFGIYNIQEAIWMSYEVVALEAEALGIDIVPLLFSGEVQPSNAFELVQELLDLESYLSGSKVEGVVIKNAHRDFLIGGQYMPFTSAKFVSEKFKEKMDTKVRSDKSSWQNYMESYRTEARWRKAVQHLAESGKLSGDPKDIGGLIKEVKQDISAEERDAIKDYLWKTMGKQLLHNATKGLPEWYKQQLAMGEINT